MFVAGSSFVCGGASLFTAQERLLETSNTSSCGKLRISCPLIVRSYERRSGASSFLYPRAHLARTICDKLTSHSMTSFDGCTRRSTTCPRRGRGEESARETGYEVFLKISFL